MGDLIKSDAELAALEADVIDNDVEAEIDPGFELEIVDPSMYGKTKSDDLVAAEAKLAELTASKAANDNSQLQSQALMETLESVKALQTQIAGGIKVDAGDNETPAFDFDAHQKKLNKDVWADPAKAINEYLNPVIGDLNSKLSGLGNSVSKAENKSEMLLSDENRAFYVKYKDEVEALAKKSMSASAYSDAIKQVKFENMDDLVQAKVDAALAAAGNPAKAPFTNTGAPSAPKVAAKTQITPGMRRYIDAMKNKGIADESYLLRRAEELKKEGSIKG